MRTSPVRLGPVRWGVSDENMRQPGLGALDADLTAVLHGAPAEELMGSELAIAGWSADDERLPATPPASA